MANRIHPPAPAQIWTASIALLVCASVVFMYTWISRADPDLWGHVRFGQDLLRSRTVVRPDTYSYLTSDSAWINHEWLAEAVFALAYNSGGTAGLVGVKLAVVLATSMTVFAYLMSQGMNPLPAGLWLLVGEHLMLPSLWSIRPQMFTCLNLACLLVVLDFAERRGLKWLWCLSPLFALWANQHGGFLAGVGALLVWLGAHTLARLSRPVSGVARFDPLRTSVLLPVFASIASTLANPYGWRLLWFLRTALVRRPEISEWNPIPLASFGGAVYLLVAALSLAGILFGARQKSPGLVAIFGVFLLSPLFAVRHTALFAIAALMIAGPQVADMLARKTGATFPPPLELPPARKRLIACFAGFAAVLLTLSVPRADCIAVGNSYPVDVVGRAKQAGVSGNMVVHFDWGEYVLWHLGPAVGVSVDGRRETVYQTAHYNANLRFMDGLGEWDELLKDQSVTMVLASKRFPSFNLMGLKPGWALMQQDDVSALFAREGTEAMNRLRAAGPLEPEPRGDRCFP